ncbi:FAST kinase domain-containing protein 2, mitochondrial-like [Formica exsecta]|uniref:FAST kinase domain-containing protein 2, mitochondrial-like n=1 Tax=Formica exsecta TaxID=72781 RepID=UPI0011446308|nr:FAST kinase domain-containing protein 2, mitochondrial-like [Formica exsecta]XP_029668272.1 FAST kinase domain-containing protein 2, mitochondrial-like [Formica exsecta]XP_029668273.1 FAST kinase domain-containing protein 2, mitochondrial-like [Formica exsecta]
MDRSLKRLLRLYPIARNWTVLSNYIKPFQSVQSVSRIYSTSLTDHTQLEDLTLLMKKNYASNDIRVPHRPMRILEEAATNYMNMTVHDVVDTMSTLFKVSRDIKDIQIIGKHIGFIRLCEVLNKDIRLMKTNDIIEMLKVFTYFKIPTNSILTQSLLQMIRTTINEISLRDIIFIVFLLKKMDSTPLRDALLIALPLVFQAQLPTKLDSEDIVLLTWSLRFANENNINNPIIQDTILKSLQKYENLDIRTAWSIFHSLCYTSHLSPTAFDILFEVQKILIANAKQLNVQEIIKILEKLVFATIKNREYGCKFYNETLVDACVNSALSSNINFNSGIYLLKLLNDLNYAHIPFLEYLAAKCFEEPNLLKDAPYFKVSIFLKGFINADYKPVFWDTIRDAILANEVENKSFRKSMIRFALHLTALDCYSPNLIKKVFSENIKANDTMKDIYARELLLLYQSVKTLYPTYDGPWPAQDILEYATVSVSPILPTYSMRAALELALGGPQYIHNDLRTRLGHYIDHVVVMRKGRYPVAINTVTSSETNTIYVEDIQTPSESQIILIFNLPDTAYAVNSQRLKSTWLLKIKSAEALTKSNTIAINSSSWMKLPEHERVPYLMQAIRLKSEDLSTSID